MDSSAIARRVREAAEDLGALGRAPRLGIVLGSGLASVSNALAATRSISFGEVRGMPAPTVLGHSGEFIAGTLADVPVLVMRGRVHAYEGHAVDSVVLGVRAMRLAGASTFVLTNAAGGIREDLEPGDVMAIADHLNLTGLDPATGLGDGELGPRFQDMRDAWDPSLRRMLAARANEAGVALAEGVYAGLRGPSYETPAEIRMLRASGADAVGMSTVLEALALRRLGARLVGLSCITNRAAGREGAVLDHQDVERRAREAATTIALLVEKVAEAVR